jgi:RecB family exonuclease
MSMTKIVHLYEILKSNPMNRKVLLASSHAQGHQWLEQASRLYGPVLNTEVRTLESWVLERCRLLLAKKKLHFISSSDSRWMVCRLLQDMAQSGTSYLSGIALSPGLANAFHQAIAELREAGVKADDLLPEDFENVHKGVFVKELLARYEEAMVKHRLIDLAGLLPYTEQLRTSGDMIIVDEYAVQSSIERSLLQTLTKGVYVMLCAEPSFTEPDSSFPAGNTEFFRALGPIAEAREVMRRITERSIPWDQVEIIASDCEKTAAAVYTVAATTHIPCTFADGLPISVTNAGKAAKLYLEWLESGYRLDPILSALKQGIVRLRDEQLEDVSTADVIRELERSGVGWGRERYKLLEKRMTADDISEERAAILRMLQRVFERLFHPLTERVLSSPEKLVHALIDFVETYAVLKEESDYQVISRLQSLEQSMQTAGEFAMNHALALRYVREGLKNVKIQTASIPAPGHIHVTSLASGGQTGRPYTFIMGMTETNWSPSFRQDPVLLDEERARISSGLLQSSEQATRRIEERNRRIGMIRGHCTMSYCSYDLSGHQENMPAYEMLQVFRRKTGQADADYEALQRESEEAVRFFRSKTGISVDAAELWMRALLSDNSRVKSGQRAVYSSYPALRDGAKAVRARLDVAWSAYDGIVETDRYPVPLPGEAEASTAFSASKLELYGRCPLQYFYQEILGVRVKDVAVYDRTQWLDAMQRGSLLHDIFNTYLISLKDRRSQGHEPIRHDPLLLSQITEQAIRRYAEEVPVPSAHVFRKEAESIRKDVNIFYASERHRPSVPVMTELKLHGEEAPFRLELSEELSIPIKGFVDRVDEIAPHRYKIYDYKTGNPRNYRQNECFSGGTQLQLALYGMAVEQWMKETGFDPEAQVVESSYFFPTERGMGEEIGRPQNRRDDLSVLLRTMMESMKQGLYPPANDPKGCARCDYSPVCGAHAEQFAEKRNAPENAERLGRILEVSRFA